MSKFKDYHSTSRYLIEIAGGEVSEDMFVEKPGVALVKDGSDINLPLVNQLVEELNIGSEQPLENQLAELAARITYSAFPKTKPTSSESTAYHKNLANLGHLSPYKIWDKENVVFLLGGVTVEGTLEIVANKGAKIARQTSSRTISMENPFYRVQGDEAFRDVQRSVLRESLLARKRILDRYDLTNFRTEDKKALPEFLNMTLPSSKTVNIFAARTLENWIEIFGKRFDAVGVETELREILSQIRNILAEKYPDLIQSEAEYYAKNVLPK